MEFLFVTVLGAGIGLGARYLVPGRGTYGLGIAPAVGAIASALTWVGLTWLGWAWDGGWIWVVSLAAAAIVPIVVALVVARVRHASDARMLHQLSGGRA